MAARLETEVKINGIDVKAAGHLIKWLVPETFGNAITNCTIMLSASILNTIPDLENGMTITIKRGPTTGTEEFIFDGEIDEVLPQVPFIKVLGKNRLVDLLRNEITKSYDIDLDPEAGVGSEIFIDMVNTFTPLAADNSSVVPTGTTNTITKFICNKTDVFQRALVIADIYGLQMLWDAVNQKVKLEPNGFVDKTTEVLEVGSNVTKKLKWQVDKTQLINDLTVEGAVQETEVEDKFSGNGVQTTFTLASVPIVVSTTVDGDDVTLGVPDSTAAFDYSVDKETKEIRFEPGSIPPAGVDNVVAKYTTAKPVPVRVKNGFSIGKFKTHRTTKHFNDVQTVEDARLRGEQFVAKFGLPFNRVPVPVLSLKTFVRPGELRRVIDTQNKKDEELVVTQVVYRWPDTEDICHCGDREYKTHEWENKTSERIKRLEEELVKNPDLLVSVEALEYILRNRQRFFTLDHLDFTATDALVWDHPQFGDWDAPGQDWGEDDNSDIIDVGQVRLVWALGIYEEEFFDEDFKDASTTANWDTAAGEIVFGASTFALSKEVYTNDEVYTGAEVTFEFSGSPTLLVSSDGGDTFTTLTLSSGLMTIVDITSTQGKSFVWKSTGTTGDKVTNILIRPLTA